MLVFPDCLSPTISSLWPLPMGTMLSKEINPVWSGSNMEHLSIIPGATDSIIHKILEDIGFKDKLIKFRKFEIEDIK